MVDVVNAGTFSAAGGVAVGAVGDLVDFGVDVVVVVGDFDEDEDDAEGDEGDEEEKENVAGEIGYWGFDLDCAAGLL